MYILNYNNLNIDLCSHTLVVKVLFFNHLPNPLPGASWVRISFFAKYLLDMGHKVCIAGAFSTTSLNKAGFADSNGIRIINMTPVIMVNNIISLFFNVLSALITSIPILLILRADVVIISVPSGEAAFGSFIVAKLFKKKIIIDYRDEWEDYAISISKSKTYKKFYRFFKRINTACYKRSNLVITVTKPLYTGLLSRNIKNVKIISNGADCNLFKPAENKNQIRMNLGFNKDDFIVIFSGSIGGYYRLDLAIKAIKKVVPKLPNIKLLIVGPGSPENMKKIIDSSAEMGISNNVVILGAKTNKTEMAALLACSDVGLVPYDSNPLWNNALPAKSFEYFASGLPIIATTYKDSALGKLIVSNDIGIISEPEDIDGLANAIEKIYYSNIESSGNRAVSLIRKYYDRNKIAKVFLNLIEVVAKS